MSVDGARWLLLNASPEIRSQLAPASGAKDLGGYRCRRMRRRRLDASLLILASLALVAAGFAFGRDASLALKGSVERAAVCQNRAQGSAD